MPQTTMTRRRSMRSEARPIGICERTLPSSTQASNVAPSAVERPVRWVKTPPRFIQAPDSAPARKAPTTATGERR
jgi:hypothetical protein